MNSLISGFNSYASRSNWTVIANELDKIGVNIEEDALGEIVEGRQAPIEKVFKRIERYLTIIAGPDFIKFENLEKEDF